MNIAHTRTHRYGGTYTLINAPILLTFSSCGDYSSSVQELLIGMRRVEAQLDGDGVLARDGGRVAIQGRDNGSSAPVTLYCFPESSAVQHGVLPQTATSAAAMARLPPSNPRKRLLNKNKENIYSVVAFGSHSLGWEVRFEIRRGGCTQLPGRTAFQGLDDCKSPFHLKWAAVRSDSSLGGICV